jgi:hypothetical protein
MSHIGTVRRLQALAAIGWTQTQIATELGTTRQTVCKAMSGRAEIGRRAGGDRGHRQNERDEALRGAALVRDLYESLRDAPAHRAKGCDWRGRVSGWYPPQAWDECDIDEPTARPWDSYAVSYYAALPILHGSVLVAHVALRMGLATSAARIAKTAGYGSVERCASVLARCRRADMGRALLARQRMAETRTAMAA